MKVLKLGNPLGYTIQAECTGRGNGGGGCGALLEVCKDDMRYYPGVPGDSWGSRDPAVMFKCCECGVCTDVVSKDWPPHARTKLQKWSKRWQDAEPGEEEDEAK